MKNIKESVTEFYDLKPSVVLFVCIFFVSPLFFFTDLTRNPYFFQITILNVSILLFCAYFLVFHANKKELPFKGGSLVFLFLFFAAVFFISSLVSYFSHNDFFKPAMYKEYKRVWLFTIFNCFAPFFISSQIGFSKDKLSYGKYLFLIFIWGILWVFFPFLKTTPSEGMFWYFFDFYGFLLWALGFIVALYAIKKVSQESLLHLAMVACAISSVYGVLQYFGIEFIWAKLLSPYGRRAVSTFGNPNFVSSFCVMVIPVAVYYLFKAEKGIERFFYSVVIVSSSAMVFASLTRSSFIGMIFSLGFIFCFREYRSVFSQKKYLKNVFWLFLALFLLWPDQNLKPASFGVGKRFYEGVKSGVSSVTLNVKKQDIYPSFHQRLLMWSCSWQMFKENPVLGKGWGGFELFFPYYQGPLIRQYPQIKELRTHANNSHNEILEIASQTGIAGLGAYSLFFIALIFYVFRFFKTVQEDDRRFLIAISASLIGMLADNMLNVSLHFAVPAFLFWWLIGTLNSRISQEKKVLIKTSFKPIMFFFAAFCLYLCLFWYNQFMREVYYFKGFKLMRKNQIAESVKELEKAYKHSDGDVNNNYELANAYSRIGENEAALNYYKEALKANAGYDEIFFNLAVMSQRLQDEQEAVKNFKTSIWINPVNKTSYQALSDILAKSFNDYGNLGVEISLDAVKMFPYEAPFYSAGAFFALKNGNKKQAADFYALALEADPLSETAFIALSKEKEENISLKAKEVLKFSKLCFDIDSKIETMPDLAMKIAQSAVDYSDNYFLKYLKAKIYFRKGDLLKAEEFLLASLEEKSEFPDALYGLANVYEKKSDYVSARRTLENMLGLYPQNARALEKLRSIREKI